MDEDPRQFVTYARRMEEDRKMFSEIAQSHDLPSLDELQKEFRFLFAELNPEPEIMLSMVVDAIKRRLYGVLQDVEGFLFGNPELRFYGHDTLTAEQYAKMRSLGLNMRRILMDPRSSSLSLDSERAAWLKDLLAQWKEVKEDILNHFEETHNGWKNVPEETEDDTKHHGIFG